MRIVYYEIYAQDIAWIHYSFDAHADIDVRNAVLPDERRTSSRNQALPPVE